MALDRLRIKYLKLSPDDRERLNLAEQRVHLLVALFVRLDAGRTRVGGDQVREEPRRLAIIVHLFIRIRWFVQSKVSRFKVSFQKGSKLESPKLSGNFFHPKKHIQVPPKQNTLLAQVVISSHC